MTKTHVLTALAIVMFGPALTGGKLKG